MQDIKNDFASCERRKGGERKSGYPKTIFTRKNKKYRYHGSY